MRDAVSEIFGELGTVERDDSRHYWRLPKRLPFVSCSAGEMAELALAVERLDRDGSGERASTLRELLGKLRTDARREPDIETLLQAEGLAMRAGPRPNLDGGLLAQLREAILTCHAVDVSYLGQSTGRWGRRRIYPYGLLYGNRAFVVGRTDRAGDIRLWRLANMRAAQLTGETFTPDPEFDLAAYARRSFGTFQEEPVEVVLRFDSEATRDASAFLFHPDQSVKPNGDGSVSVRFRAGGIDEMCWHLFTWGEHVTVEEPEHLRQRLATMCATLAAHHRERRGGQAE